MRIRITKAFTRWRAYGPCEVGATLDLPDQDAEILIRNGLAEPLEKPPEGKPEKATGKTLYSRLRELAEGNELVMIVGDGGVGKTRLCLHMALEHEREEGGKVLYLDTEGSASARLVRGLKAYERLADPEMELAKITERVSRARREEGLTGLVVDSVGLPGLVRYARLGLRQRGEAQLELARLLQQCYAFAVERSGLAVVTNQPVSELASAEIEGREPRVQPGEPLPPWGGKAAEFVSKLILRAEVAKRGEWRTEGRLQVYKARDLPRDLEVARYVITKEGVSVEWKV
jgi:KaiC/GvpD/RAD55 family RecA-like ATPase